jgi:hypothetical protein
MERVLLGGASILEVQLQQFRFSVLGYHFHQHGLRDQLLLNRALSYLTGVVNCLDSNVNALNGIFQSKMIDRRSVAG